MRLSTRLSVGVATLAAAVGAVVAPATPAFAAATITADPDSSLYDGQTIMVSGSGFSPNQSLALVECNLDTAAATNNDPYKSCDINDVVLDAVADANGALPPTPITVRTGQLGSDASSVCNYSTNGHCVIAAGDPSTFQLLAFAPIAFSSVTVTPATGLHNGDTVEVAGAGLPGNTDVYILECNSDVPAASGCKLTGAVPATTDAQGALAPTSFVVATGQLGSDPASVCDASTSACVITVVDKTSQQPYGFAPIGFAPDRVSTSISIKSTDDKVSKGDKFAIKGRLKTASGGVNGVVVKLYSRAKGTSKWGKADDKTTTPSGSKAGSYKFGGLKESSTKEYRVKSVKTTVGASLFLAATSSKVTVKFV